MALSSPRALILLFIAAGLLGQALGSVPLGWAEIVEEHTSTPELRDHEAMPAQYARAMDASPHHEDPDRDRRAIVNGWEIDTRQYPSIDEATSTPWEWARRAIKRNGEGNEEADEADGRLKDESMIALVQVQPPLAARKVREIEAYLGVALGDYHARNTYVLIAPRSVVQRASTAPHIIWVGWMVPELKIAEGLQNELDASARKRGISVIDRAFPSGVTRRVRTRGASTDSMPTAITLIIHLVPQQRSEEALFNFAKQFQMDLRRDRDVQALFKPLPIMSEDVRSSYRERLRVTVQQDTLEATVQWLSTRLEVSTIDRMLDYKVLNKWAALVLQSNGTSPKDRRSSVLWDYGLSGQGQIIGISDTGIDTSNCLFYDPVNPVGIDHRKIVAYMNTFGVSTNDRDGLHGHGTHVAGSAAGSVTCGTSDCGSLNNSQSETERRWEVNNFQGVAFNARIAFIDLADSSGCPADVTALSGVDASNLQSLYNAGARILSNSWGCSSPNPENCRTYDVALTLPLDDWAYTHPTALVVFAAGNEGSDGLGSVSSPGLGKNFLTVGASRNTYQSFDEAYNTFINYTYVREEYNRLNCPSGCDAGCCYLSESDCCNGIGNPPVINRACCGSFYRTQLKARESWLIFSQDSVAGFSSLGPVTGGATGSRIKPDIVAPGEVVISANGNCGYSFSCGSADSFRMDPSAVWWLQGTSMATPLTAGSAALVREYFMRGYYPSGVPNDDDAFTPLAALLKAVIINSGQDISGFYVNSSSNSYRKLKNDHPNDYVNWIGHGRVTLDRTLYFRDYTPMYRRHDLYVFQSTNSSTSLDTGESITFNFVNVGNRAPFSATLVWMDPAGESLANDLDLSVSVDNNGTVTSYWGNHLYNSNTRDSANNVERVYLARRVIRSLVNITVTVSATSISSGSSQTFALVVTCDEQGLITSSGHSLRPHLWLIVSNALSWLFCSLFPSSSC